MNKIKTINRNIVKQYEDGNKTYGTDNKGNYFKLISTVQKVKNSIDDYEFVLKWVKVHPMSYEKMSVVCKFNKMV